MKDLIKKAIKSLVSNRHLMYKGHCSHSLYLTFDDGPCNQVTPKLLALLDQYNIKATFFVIGSIAKEQPELMDTIIARGHTVANHSYFHRSFKALSLDEQLEEIENTNEVLTAHSANTSLFRPPQGTWTLKLLLKLISMKTSIAMWSRDSYDSHHLSVEQVVKKFTDTPVVGGDILLFHDDDMKIIQILEKLLPIWQEENFSFKVLSSNRIK